MSVVAGIDPGLDGAVFVIEDGNARAFITPTLPAGKGTKRLYDVGVMAGVVDMRPSLDLVVIEQQRAFGGPLARQKGTASAFSTGYGYGLWLGILSALRIPYEAVTPQAWHRALLGGLQGDNKARAIQKAQALFPSLDLRRSERARISHSGIADAVCLSWLALKMMKRKGGT